MKNIGYFFIVVLLTAFLGSCKKMIENAQEDLIVKAMTDGQWRVTLFKRDANDVTTDFAPYKFQFRTNKTVDAINNGSVETTGTWEENAANKTISSNFPNGNSTLALLNGTWLITKNSWTYVEATQSVNNEVRSLRLDK